MNDRQKWLEERRTGIGGSDVAAILGLNAYASPYSVWADKLGFLPEQEDAETMRQGRDLEEYVAQRFCEKSGKKVRRINRMFRHPEHSFMIANIDRDVVGEDSGLECKTTSAFSLKKFNGGEFPVNYYCQCVHYMTVKKYSRWYLAVLVLGTKFMVYQMTRIENDTVLDWCDGSVYVDQAEIDSLIQAEREFWQLVETETPPDIDGSLSTQRAIDYVSDRCEESETVFIDEYTDLIRLESIHTQINQLAIEMETIKQKLKVKMGGTGKAHCEKYEVIWSKRQRVCVDKQALIKYCPGPVLNKVLKVKPYKIFKIRKGE